MCSLSLVFLTTTADVLVCTIEIWICVENLRCGGNDLRSGFYAVD